MAQGRTYGAHNEDRHHKLVVTVILLINSTRQSAHCNYYRSFYRHNISVRYAMTIISRQVLCAYAISVDDCVSFSLGFPLLLVPVEPVSHCTSQRLKSQSQGDSNTCLTKWVSTTLYSGRTTVVNFWSLYIVSDCFFICLSWWVRNYFL